MSTTGSLARFGLVGSRAVLAVVAVGYTAASLVGAAPGLAARSWLYLALMVGISLPHGGFEHAANLRGRRESVQARYLAAYVALLGVALAVFATAPGPGLALAVSIVVLKGGHGGLSVLEATAGTGHLRSRFQRLLAVVARGGAVMVVPFVLHPGIFSVVSVRMVRLFGGDLTAVTRAFRPGIRAALGAAYATAVAIHLGLGYLRGRQASGASGWAATRGYRIDAAETLLLVAFFAAVPPILAVGIYFPTWYATRQTARLLTAGDDHAISWRAVVRSGVTRAGPVWVAAVGVFAAVATVVPTRPLGPVAWVALYSVVVSAIAVPHVAVGAWLDRRQGIWSVAA